MKRKRKLQKVEEDLEDEGASNRARLADADLMAAYGSSEPSSTSGATPDPQDLAEQLESQYTLLHSDIQRESWVQAQRSETALPTLKDGDVRKPQRDSKNILDKACQLKVARDQRWAEQQARAEEAAQKAAAEAAEAAPVAEPEDPWIEARKPEKFLHWPAHQIKKHMRLACVAIKHKSIPELQVLIGKTAQKVLANPSNLGDLEICFQLMDHADEALKKMAFMSAVVCLKDLVPMDKIRELTDKETAGAAKLSRAVLELQAHDQGILHFYDRILRKIEELLKKSRQSDVKAGLMATIQLVSRHPNFNYQSRLITLFIRGCHTRWPAFNLQAAQALGAAFKLDVDLEFSRQLLHAYSTYVQTFLKNWSRNKTLVLAPALLQGLLGLPLHRSREADLRRESKHVLHQAGELAEELEADFERCQLTVAPAKLRKQESKILYDLFVLYLRILRHPYTSQDQEVAQSVLRGLGQHAQMIDMELYLDILKEIKGLLKEALLKSQAELALEAIFCVCQLLDGPTRKAFDTDLGWVLSGLLDALSLSLSACQAKPEVGPLLVRAISQVLSSPSIFHGGVTSRDSALTQICSRLLAVSLNFPQSELTRLALKLLSKYPVARRCLDREDTEPVINYEQSEGTNWLEAQGTSEKLETAHYMARLFQFHYDHKIARIFPGFASLHSDLVDLADYEKSQQVIQTLCLG